MKYDLHILARLHRIADAWDESEGTLRAAALDVEAAVYSVKLLDPMPLRKAVEAFDRAVAAYDEGRYVLDRYLADPKGCRYEALDWISEQSRFATLPGESYVDVAGWAECQLGAMDAAQ